jgi:hypothetical protein
LTRKGIATRQVLNKTSVRARTRGRAGMRVSAGWTYFISIDFKSVK